MAWNNNGCGCQQSTASPDAIECPIYCFGDDVVTTTETDALGRTIIKVDVDPALVSGLDAQVVADAFAGMTLIQRSAIAALLIDPVATNTVVLGPNGLIYEND